MTSTLTSRMDALRTERTPFVRATVVRAQQPSSAHPGDAAIVLADGSIEGFVGGQCAEGSVRSAALHALECGETVLLRVLPSGEAAFPQAFGADFWSLLAMHPHEQEAFADALRLQAALFYVA